MFEGHVAGKLHGHPVQRTGRTGNPYVVAKVKVLINTGEMVVVSAIAFDPEAQEALLALDAGDAVSLVGPFTPKAWIDPKTGEARPSADMTATQVLTVYHAKRKRDAMAAAGEQQPRQDPLPRRRAPGLVSIPEDEKDVGVLLDGERWEAALLTMPDWHDVPLTEECH